ncbi:hypothetical protein GJ496_002186 [Pomphorhynchus laevis]|nr:hypothetical protein GJ496_002186 [Pomphorhynchus laevis]
MNSNPHVCHSYLLSGLLFFAISLPQVTDQVENAQKVNCMDTTLLTCTLPYNTSFHKYVIWLKFVKNGWQIVAIDGKLIGQYNQSIKHQLIYEKNDTTIQSSLRIADMSIADSGIYVCKTSTAESNEIVQFNIEIQPKVHIRKEHRISKTFENHTKLTCSVLCAPPNEANRHQNNEIIWYTLDESTAYKSIRRYYRIPAENQNHKSVLILTGKNSASYRNYHCIYGRHPRGLTRTYNRRLNRSQKRISMSNNVKRYNLVSLTAAINVILVLLIYNV